jgi:hypothetical protein
VVLVVLVAKAAVMQAVLAAVLVVIQALVELDNRRSTMVLLELLAVAQAVAVVAALNEVVV